MPINANKRRFLKDLAALVALYPDPELQALFQIVRRGLRRRTSGPFAQALILSAIEDGAATYAEIAEETGFSIGYLSSQLSRLETRGLVKSQTESSPLGRPRKYFFLSQKK